MIEFAEGITPSLKSIKFPVNNNDWSELNLKKLESLTEKISIDLLVKATAFSIHS